MILVVEDDPGIAVLQRRRLERAGFRAIIATDVAAAMDRLRQADVDLVLMDYRLGSTTALDLHGHMKASGLDVPVVIVSGSSDDQIVIDAIRAGVRDVIFKSSGYLDRLPDAVRDVLGQTGRTDRPSVDQARATVLIVEDDPGVATLERRQLERAGYDVVVAATPDEAMVLLETARITLAVLDLRLPGGVSGIDLYERIKAAGWLMPAILVTGFPDQSIAIRALRAGIRDFVPKSSDYLEYLPAAIDRIMSQVRMERKLLESELRLASIIGAAMDAILMSDAQRRVLLFNRAAEAMFGCPAEEAMRGTLDRFLPGLSLPAMADVPTPAGRIRGRAEIDAVRSDGSRLPIEVAVSDVVVESRRLFTIIARDVSERRRIEADLRDADRRKDEFLGMLAHELRNPLAAITGAGEVLHRAMPDDRLARVIDVVRRQARVLTRMVDDLLDVSRVTLGKIRITREPVLLPPLAARAAEGVREAVNDAGLTLETRIEPDELWVHGDATRLEQVLSNLLTNAIKYTPGGGHIRLDVGRDGGTAVLRVHDTGIGMEPSLVPRVFDLFVQGDTSLARARGGLGIGLALVRQVVALHGGDVSATSHGVGHGSEFVVRLPIAATRGSGRTATTDAWPVHHLRIVVVDDQRDVADTLALLLQGQGHDVRTVYDASSALAEAIRDRPDVMIVDIGMPGMTGYELAASIRREPHLAGIRLVALTGYGTEEDRGRARDAGFDVHLTKPIDPDRLPEALAPTLPPSRSPTDPRSVP